MTTLFLEWRRIGRSKPDFQPEQVQVPPAGPFRTLRLLVGYSWDSPRGIPFTSGWEEQSSDPSVSGMSGGSPGGAG